MIVSEFTLQKREDATSGGCCMDGEEIRAIAKRVSNWSEFQKEIQE